MIEVATIKFHDLNTGSDAVAIIKHIESQVYLCLSIESNGDLSVTLDKREDRELLVAMQRALGL